ncbi:hypothetical protein T484DRAFT_1881842, partial [Baffinella frigidus]
MLIRLAEARSELLRDLNAELALVRSEAGLSGDVSHQGGGRMAAVASKASSGVHSRFGSVHGANSTKGAAAVGGLASEVRRGGMLREEVRGLQQSCAAAEMWEETALITSRVQVRRLQQSCVAAEIWEETALIVRRLQQSCAAAEIWEETALIRARASLSLQKTWRGCLARDARRKRGGKAVSPTERMVRDGALHNLCEALAWRKVVVKVGAGGYAFTGVVNHFGNPVAEASITFGKFQGKEGMSPPLGER